MKTKKGSATFIAVIVVIVAVTFAVIGWMFAKKAEAPVAPSVAVAQPTAPAAQTQPAQVTESATQTPPPAAQPLVTGKVGAVYTNTDYGFQFTMPQDWMNIVGDYMVTTGKMASDGTPYIEFAAEATDKEWLNNKEDGFPKGYADLFEISVLRKSDWDKDAKTCDKKTELCLSSQTVLGEKDQNVFTIWLPQDGPSNFSMYSSAAEKIADPQVVIKNGFKLISQIQSTASNDKQ